MKFISYIMNAIKGRFFMDAIIRKFDMEDMEELHKMIEHTIEESYKWVYSEQVRQVLKNQHVDEQIIDRAENEYVLVAIDPEDEDRIIGTGSLIKCRIFGVYVKSEYQGNGIGIRLMEELEDKAIGNGIKKLILSASISSKDFYEKLGYKGKPKIIKLDNGKEYIVYDMEKELQ